MASIRTRRHRSRINKTFTLQLTSLMDALMIIVVFLLKSYGISAMGVIQSDHLELPVSKAPETFGEGLALIVTRDKIYLDNEVILEFEGDPEEKKFTLPEGEASRNWGIRSVYDALTKKKEDFELLASRSDNPEENAKKWTGDLLLQADKHAPYELLRKVMYSAGRAGYRMFRLTVEKRPE